MSSFIHLHNHTHYSLLDGACTVDDLVSAAVQNGMSAVALTDHGVMFGAVEFYKKAKKQGIRPIIGNEMYMVTRGSRLDKASSETHPEGKRHGYNHLVLLAKNETGYRNLVKLTTIGHTEGFYYKPRIDFEVLERHSEGLIALTACAGGVVASYLAANDYDAARDVATRLKDIFADDVYLEIQDHGIDRERIVREGMVRLSRELGMKLIATNDSHYVKPEHAVPHNVLLHIADVREAEDIQRLRYETDQVYFKSADEMHRLFRDFPEAITSTLEVADKCAFEMELGTNHMPAFPIPSDSKATSLDDYMRQLAEEGLGTRYKATTSEITDRLEYELGVISRMGYAGYFLIVQDFINAAKRNGIRVGPGRGSAAGSLVAYALGITDVDPLRYDLLFERFLNPDRVSMPDIDVDFQDDRRDEVIQYVREKYGAGSVSQIITFGKLSARAVLKDVGRVLGLPIATVESITKHIPVKMGKVQPLASALGLAEDDDKWEPVKELSWVRESTDPKIRQLVEYSLVLEGFVRGAGMHAAGVVIAPSDTSDYVPLYKTPSTELMTMYNMSDLEEAGLLKMDFLGLITLTVIDRTLAMMRQTRGIDLDIDAIPLDDEKTYEMFGDAHTVGVFQFESVGMREYLHKLKPRSIDDLAAMNALYRPGPMEFIDDFIDRKHGRKKITYLHAAMEPILASTYGIIVYQEQVMQLASEIAGFTLAQSDLMRRAMGKKKADVMAQQRTAFVEGAGARGISAKIASEIFDMIDSFANYGFNKSHSVAYSLLAYQTAYLKANFTPEFMAAMMTSGMDKTDDVVVLIDECHKLGIDVRPPDVNASHVSFKVTDGTIRFGMAAIRNVGVGAVESIVEARTSGGSFTDIFDFCERVGTRAVNKKTLESLVMAGAFDSLHDNRAALFDVIESAIAWAQQRQQHREAGQSSLFDNIDSGSSSQVAHPPIPERARWTDQITLAHEKSVLGLYISGHPLEIWRQEADVLGTVRLGEADPTLDRTQVRVCGIISALRTKIDRSGNTMAFVTLEDFTGKAEVLIFAKSYQKCAPAVEADKAVVITGRAEVSGDALKVMADDVLPIETAMHRFATGLLVTIDSRQMSEAQVRRGIEALDELRGTGDCPVFFHVTEPGGEAWHLMANRHRVRASADVLRRLRAIFGKQNVRITTDTIS